MGVAIGGLVSFLFALFLALIIFSTLWVIFVRVILPIGFDSAVVLGGFIGRMRKSLHPKKKLLKSYKKFLSKKLLKR